MSNSNTTKNKGKTARKMALIGLLCAAFLASGTGLMITGIRAYLTHTDRAVNTFTVGEITIDTLEPNYPGNGSDEVKDQVPLQETPKDPQIKNTGKNRAVVFAQIDIPMANIIVATENGLRLDRANTELFGFRTTSGEYNSYHSEKWVELETTYLNAKDQEVDKSVAAKVRRLYGYRMVLEEDETTLPVFDVVRLCNVVEGYIDNSIRNIVVTSYAIQADNIAGITTEDHTEFADAGILHRIFDVYVNQSSAIEPDDADNGNNQTLIGTTLNVTMTVQNTHLRLNSGNPADAKTTTVYNVAYAGPDKDRTPTPVFTSSDTSVVTVDQNGDINAVGVGTAVITMEATNPDTGNVARATVTVSVRDMNAGESQANGISLLSDDMEDTPVTATGSDAEVSTVESDNNINESAAAGE